MPSHFLKAGDFRFDMGLRRGSPDYFRNSGPPDLLAERRALLATENPSSYAAALDGAEPLLRETAEFARSLDIPVGDSASPAELGRLWEPDFVLLDEALRVQAGCVCFPSFWSLPEKLGEAIDLVHAPVPGLNADLGAKIRIFLERLKPGELWERWNWGLAATPERNCHPAMLRPRLDASATPATTWFRVEHQALVRLPATGAILFGIRIQSRTLHEEMAAAPEFGATLKRLLETMPEAVLYYKGLAACREPLMAMLG
jgi:dimethylamine monooxygenase subunit A